ncbi:hypothetical protein [Parapedobacter koreensis]|uniref:Uncharacterized protein n=1 Tax=Parapedobacter koreensis TaxID=332977 RepID=A0A1H7UDE4_9SPHI|nr:hypothetical protein [Parapedobacter koreensis]SEL95023.1 hypothetical protein SAMN05421740_1157 [Parapedobacter koreensis]
MEPFKVEIFKEENQGKVFGFVSLDEFESGKVVGMLLSLTGITNNRIETPVLFKHLERYIPNKVRYDDKGAGRDFLQSLMSELSIKGSASSYIIWDMVSRVDEFKVESLIDDWDYVWYDTSDEAMVIYIPENKTVLLVTDHGYAAYKKYE